MAKSRHDKRAGALYADTLSESTRKPRARSAWRTQLRSDCATQRILAAIDANATHRDACSCWWSSGICTASSRSSDETFAAISIAPYLSKVGATEKVGAVQLHVPIGHSFAAHGLGSSVVTSRYGPPMKKQVLGITKRSWSIRLNGRSMRPQACASIRSAGERTSSRELRIGFSRLSGRQGACNATSRCGGPYQPAPVRLASRADPLGDTTPVAR